MFGGGGEVCPQSLQGHPSSLDGQRRARGGFTHPRHLRVVDVPAELHPVGTRTVRLLPRLRRHLALLAGALHPGS